MNEEDKEKVQHLLMDCWTCDFYERLLANAFPSLITTLPVITKAKNNHEDDGSSQAQSRSRRRANWLPKIMKSEREPPSDDQQHVVHEDLVREIYESKVGVPLWSRRWESGGSRNLHDGSDTTAVTATLPSSFSQSSPSRYSSPSESSAVPPCATRPSRSPQSTTSSSASASRVAQEMSSGKLAGHALFTPYRYGDPAGPAPQETQPFRVVVHPQAALVCDTHAHLSEAEVIGLLAGRWDAAQRVLYVQLAIPCTAVVRGDKGKTDVEMDAIADVRAREIVERCHLQVVGWYHSHPRFAPSPSLIDVLNQAAYQEMFDQSARFVGLIVSTYDPQRSAPAALHEWFHVKPFAPPAESGGSGAAQPLPLRLHAEYLALRCERESEERDAALARTAALLLSTSSSLCGESGAPSVAFSFEAAAARVDDALVSLSLSPCIAHDDTDTATTQPALSEENSLSEKDHEREPHNSLSQEPPRPTESVSLTEDALPLTTPTLESERETETQGVRRSGRATKQRAFYDDAQFAKPKRAKAELSLTNTQNAQPALTTPVRRESSRKTSLTHTPLSPPPLSHSNNSRTPRRESDHTVLTSLLHTIHSTQLSSSQLAREILCEAPVYLRHAALLLVALGVYYSRSAVRVDISRAWKDSPSKLVKWKRSVTRFFACFAKHDDMSVMDVQAERLLARTLLFYEMLWGEYSRNGKLRK